MVRGATEVLKKNLKEHRKNVEKYLFLFLANINMLHNTYYVYYYIHFSRAFQIHK